MTATRPILTLTALLALALSACGGGGGPETATPEGPATDATETTGGPSPTGEAGGPQGEAIKIGFFAPLTGPAAADGESAKRGAELAAKLQNEEGGVLGRPLELVVYDDAFSPDEAANVTRRLIEQDGVQAIVSGSYSFTTRAAAPIANQAGVPFMSAYAVHPSITQTGEFVWRVGAMADVQGSAGAKLVTDQIGAQRVGLLIIDNDFGASLADAFRQQATEFGAEIVYEQKYPLGESDFRPLIGQLQNANPDAVYAIGYFSEAASFVKQADQAGLEAQIVGQEGYDSPTFLELAGDAAEGVIITTDLDRDSERESVQQFLTRFEEEYGERADMVGASSFDAVRVLAAAMEAAGSAEPDGVLEGLRQLEDFEKAVTGPILRFTEGREVVRPISSQVVEDGEFHFYAEFDDPELITPPQ
jgi:branched-chain amino acid transport system substrate-binding protein